MSAELLRRIKDLEERVKALEGGGKTVDNRPLMAAHMLMEKVIPDLPKRHTITLKK